MSSSIADARASVPIEDEWKQNLSQSVDLDQFETLTDLDWEETLTSVRQKNNINALNFIEELNLCYGTPAVIHHMNGLVSVRIALLIDDLNEKEIHLKDAIESARKAVSLSPNWAPYVHFYANLLYIASNDRKGYEEVIQECSRVLSIENPNDPEKGSLQEVSIREAEQNIRLIIQKSNIALISIWMKKIWTEIGGNKVDSAPTKQISKDPIEVESCNKSKKSNKTREERRKEIEVRVAAARILQQQQKSTLLKSKNVEGQNYRVSSHRKHKNLQKIFPSVLVKRNQIQSYWNTLSLDKKQSLLTVSVHDLETHFKDGLEMEVLSEALSVSIANGTWQFWACPSCNEKFTDSSSITQHVLTDHIKFLSRDLQSVFPQIVGDHWVSMILNGPWLPIDISSALRMLEGSKDTSESSPDKGKVQRSTEKVFYLGRYWPLSDDSERMEFLENVQIMLLLLLKHKYLTASHIAKVIQFTMDKIQRIPLGSRFLNIGLEKTLLSLCFLSPPQLKKVLKFLEELSDYGGLGREMYSSIDETHSVTQEIEIKESIVFSGGSLCLFSVKSGSMDDSADSDPLLTWILEEGPSSGEQLASWKRMREDKTCLGMEILRKIYEENSVLENLCRTKCEMQNRVAALDTVKRVCLREHKERDQAIEFISQSYEIVLQKRKEELVEKENDEVFDVVSDVLNDAQSLKVSQFGYEESGKDEDWRMQDLLHQADTCVEKAFLRHKDWFSVEFSKIDANITHSGSLIWALEFKLRSFSAHDYRMIVLPLLKSILKSHLEELADKYATEKSEAAKEAFLSELALDAKKSINKGGDHSKQKHKSKNKKKGHQKAKDLKATGGEKAS